MDEVARIIDDATHTQLASKASKFISAATERIDAATSTHICTNAVDFVSTAIVSWASDLPELEKDTAAPYCLFGFNESVSEEFSTKVRESFENHGLDIKAKALPNESEMQFFVVTASLDQLEQTASGLTYMKRHTALEPKVERQKLGKIEFRADDRTWRDGYQGINGDVSEFWPPCEQSQLLMALSSQVTMPAEDLQKFLEGVGKRKREVALETCDKSLLTALQIADIMPVAHPMHNGDKARKQVWQQGKYRFLAPVVDIHRYFGAGVALYFAWLNSFTLWLRLPAAVGLLCNMHMRWYDFTVDDDPYLPFYGLFVVFWSVLFACFWERECAVRAWTWNTFNQGAGEQIRPTFSGILQRSPATGQLVRYFPRWERYAYYSLSVLVTLLMLGVAFFIMVCFLNLQGYMQEHYSDLEKMFYIHTLAQFATEGALFDPLQTDYLGTLTYIPIIGYALVIQTLNKLYGHVALWLTTKENHEFQVDHENSLILKRFLFEAFDCYVVLFYVAFVMQDVRKLRSELISLYTIDSLRRIFCETLLPWWMGRRESKKVKEKISRKEKTEENVKMQEDKKAQEERITKSEAAEQLAAAEYEEFDDYLEMVIEFGYITLFASAFPMASMVSIFSNVIELKSDLFKLCRVYRRPIPERVATMGAWGRVMWAIVFLSVLTNVMIFAMSEQLASWMPSLYREARAEDIARGLVADIADETSGTKDLVIRQGKGKYVVFIACALEHIVGLIVLIIFYVFPRQPEWLSDEIDRIEYDREQLKAKKACNSEALK